jgi:hypothetical protein
VNDRIPHTLKNKTYFCLVFKWSTSPDHFMRKKKFNGLG